MIKFGTFWFSKVGKGIPQVHLRDSVSGELLYEDDGKTKPKMGNEQYQALQLVSFEKEVTAEDGTVSKVTVESISEADPESFLSDALESVEGDVAKAARMFRKGWNDVTRQETGGTDDYTKAARGILKLGLAEFKGKSEAQIIEWLKTRG
jgi:hypothetical protein